MLTQILVFQAFNAYFMMRYVIVAVFVPLFTIRKLRMGNWYQVQLGFNLDVLIYE